MRAALEAAQRQQEEVCRLRVSQLYVFSRMSLCNIKQMSPERAEKNSDRSGEEESLSVWVCMNVVALVHILRGNCCMRSLCGQLRKL